MAKTTRFENRIELLQGTLDLLILQTLQWGPQHGYGVAQAIRANSSEVLQVDTGSLYPALHRLERRKWIAASWKVSDNKQRTRVYRLTAAGRRQLASERSKWAQLVEAMAGILNGSKTGGPAARLLRGGVERSEA
jgi:transcriptional regulator